MTSYNNDNPILRRDPYVVGPYCHGNIEGEAQKSNNVLSTLPCHRQLLLL